MLRAGGTAVDAAVAAAFAAFVVEPVLSGPLGAGVMAVADPGRAPVYLDGVPKTPRAKRSEADLDLETITVDFGADTQDFHIGAATIAVPCLIPMLLSAQAQAGRVPLPDLLAPAIRHAREGHELSALQAKLVTLVAPILTADQGSRDLFMAEGALLGPGARFANPALGDVLDVLSHEGARFVTEGEIAALLRDLPGHHLGPLDRAAPRERAPLTVTRRGTAVALNPSPSLGGLSIALALSALPPDPDPAEIARGFAEIDRVRRDFDTAAEFAAAYPALARGLQETLAAPAAVRGTTHISVIDGAGAIAALTLSNGEGCGRMLPGTGIMPNNMLGEEDLLPRGPLSWAPDTRLSTMMCPTILRRGSVAVALGSGGSSRIRSALTTVSLALIDRGAALESAIAGPRLHAEAGRLAFEDTGGEAWRETLLAEDPEARVFPEPSVYFGGVHAVRAEADAREAVADARRDGWAVTG